VVEVQVIEATGPAFTVTVVVEAAEAHPATVAVTLYTPACPVVMPEITGFCRVDVYPLGPDQA
jgi:hypothetical protein